MAGGVSPFEWIFPAVGASHALYNAGAQAAVPEAKLVTPTSPINKQRNAADRLRVTDQAEAQRLGAANTAREQEAERARVEGLPSNVRKRAVAGAASLGLTGEKRPGASAYLAGVSA